MKLSELWLREWINPALTREQLCACLTMSGLEVEGVTPVAEQFSHVVIAKVLRVEPHPEADRLQVCEVDVGSGKTLTIVCGAKNVAANKMVAAALDGAVLSDNTKITTNKLRGVVSQGMLCSARELGLAEESEGLFLLPADAPLGKNVWEYLKLNDYVMDISITPNRGDCLSVLGMTHEIAALTQAKAHIPKITPVAAKNKDKLSVVVHAPAECPRYVGRVIRNITADAVTPIWLQERLRRSGVRCISPVVDVMNYVMLELGQPMHAFDLAKISGGVQVRMAKAGETLELLDGQTVNLDPATLVIADDKTSLAVAGVMGGLSSAVTLLTKDVFLESAFFQAASIARTSRQYNLNSDSSYRFERGVDPLLQTQAIERATQLIIEIAGGEPGLLTEVASEKHLPQQKKISLRAERIQKVLGLTVPDHEIEAVLQRLGFVCKKNKTGWDVIVTARRFDVTTEIDLVEEVIRVYGYDKIPLNYPISQLHITGQSEKKLSLPIIRHALSDLGYHEVVTYSFVDKKLQALTDPDAAPKELMNPMTSEMAVMRTTLLPGLLNTLLYNQNRQQTRARIFETGLRFIVKDGALLQQPMLSGLVNGSVAPEQWSIPLRAADFFDVKGDLENLIALTGAAGEFEFKPGKHPAFHPGQTAEVYRAGKYLGVLGALHPRLTQTLDLQGKTFAFELQLDQLVIASQPHFTEVSKFPEIRRDIAILVDQTIPVQSIRDTIEDVAGELLQNVNVFDVYQGKGVALERKSVALSLTLQHASRTLVDEEVASLMERVVNALKQKFAAELRG